MAAGQRVIVGVRADLERPRTDSLCVEWEGRSDGERRERESRRRNNTPRPEGRRGHLKEVEGTYGRMQAMHRNVRRHHAERGDEGYNLEHRGEENEEARTLAKR